MVNYAGNVEKAQEVVAAIEAAGSKAFTGGVPKAIAVQPDMSNPDDVRQLFETARVYLDSETKVQSRRENMAIQTHCI